MRLGPGWCSLLVVSVLVPEVEAAKNAATKAGRTGQPLPNAADGIDVNGLSQSLKDGGIAGLSNMLSAFKAMHSLGGNNMGMHIKKDADGRDMYDFTMDTPAPTTTTTTTELPPVPPAPSPAASQQAGAPSPSTAAVAPTAAVAALPAGGAAFSGSMPVSAAGFSPVQAQGPRALPLAAAAPAPLQGMYPPGMYQAAAMAPPGYGPMAAPMPMVSPMAYMGPAPGQYMGAPMQMAGISDNLVALRQGMDQLVNKVYSSATGSGASAAAGGGTQQAPLAAFQQRLEQLEAQSRQLAQRLETQEQRITAVEAREKRQEAAFARASHDRHKLRSQLSTVQQRSRLILRKSVQPLESLVSGVENQIRNFGGIHTVFHDRIKPLSHH